MNYLEQLIFEWYRYQGYHVLENSKIGLRKGNKKKSGGYNNEIDIMALHSNGTLIHIEASTKDLRSISKLKKKFNISLKAYREEYRGFVIKRVKKRAYFLHNKEEKLTTLQREVKEVELLTVAQLFAEIYKKFQTTGLNKIVPEKYPILRTVQLFIHQYQRIITLS